MNFDLVDSVQKSVELQVEKFYSRHQIENRPEVMVHLDDFADSMCVTMKQMIYGKTIEKIEVSYPQDWWQAFRDRWFPKWWLSRFPVKNSHHKLVAQALYPSIPVIKGHKHHLIMIHNNRAGSL